MKGLAMKKKALSVAAVLTLLCLAPASAHAFALELTGPEVRTFRAMGDQWKDLYGDAVFQGSGFSFDVEFFRGLAVTLGYNYLSTSRETHHYIDSAFQLNNFDIGPTYRFAIQGWIYPYVSSRFLLTKARETIGDKYMTFHMSGNAAGIYLSTGCEVYPFHMFNKGVAGLGLGLELFYSTEKTNDFGKIDNISGPGIVFNFLIYRWDWSRYNRAPRERVPEAPAEGAPTP